jgi:hypothetical protein
MQRDLIFLDSSWQKTYQIDSTLSFKKFIHEIELRAGKEKTVKKHLSRFILHRAKRNPAWREDVDVKNLTEFEPLLELIYSTLVSPFADEETTFWGLGLPFIPSVFYGTTGMYRFLEQRADGTRLFKPDEHELYCRKLKTLYSFILHKVYNYPVVSRYDFFHPVEEDGTVKYMKINLDLRFIDVKPKGILPKLNVETLGFNNMDDRALEILQERLPLSLFSFEGFSIITATDASSEYVIDQIKGAIADDKPQERFHTIAGVLWLLKSMIADKTVEFGIFPLPQLNDRIAIPYTTTNPLSILIRNALELGISEKEFLNELEEYKSTSNVKIYNRDDALKAFSATQRILNHTSFKSLTLIPIYYNNELIGILEAFSSNKGGLGEECLGEIGMTIPWMSQLVHKSLEEFNFLIMQLVKDGFTTIQPSVEWKFKEAAFKHLKRFGRANSNRELGRVSFEEVFPLYGAVDIRNSTVERNQALKADLQLQVEYLLDILKKAKHTPEEKTLSEKKLLCEEWLLTLAGPITSNIDLSLSRFLTQEIHPLLNRLREENEEIKKMVDDYFIALHQHGQSIYRHRKELEESIKLINTSLAEHLQTVKQQMLGHFPNYFETFRTDGLEYDVYVGQSIAPEKPFNQKMIHDLRLLQLSSMADAVALTESLISKMPVPLQTTQLIFVHENPIDISFRNDEKRFGVEGAYNIRYEILKKRIDKVHVKDTGERLTQPGKIAIIYFSDQIADEYAEHISTLQKQNVLSNEIEFLELEELQGVSGLKAIRVSANTKNQNLNGKQIEETLHNLH